MVSTIRVSTHLPPIRAHRGGIVRGRRGRERRAGSCGLGETQNALPAATAIDTRRTRTDISTRCSVMRSACRPLARGTIIGGGGWGALGALGWTKKGSGEEETEQKVTRDPGTGTTPLEYGCYYYGVELAPSTSGSGRPRCRLLCAGGPHSRDGALRLIQPERGTSSSVQLASETFLRRSGVDLPPICRRAA